MLRNDWKFDYAAPKLAEAVRAKLNFNNQQLNFWLGKRGEILAAIKSDGIEVNEKLVLRGGVSPKARDWDRGGEIMIRNDLRKGLQETFEKLKYHTQRRDTYDAWLQALEDNQAKTFSLDITDWLFFFGRDVGTDDDGDIDDVLDSIG